MIEAAPRPPRPNARRELRSDSSPSHQQGHSERYSSISKWCVVSPITSMLGICVSIEQSKKKMYSALVMTTVFCLLFRSCKGPRLVSYWIINFNFRTHTYDKYKSTNLPSPQGHMDAIIIIIIPFLALIKTIWKVYENTFYSRIIKLVSKHIWTVNRKPQSTSKLISVKVV